MGCRRRHAGRWRVLGGNPTRNDIQELFGQHDVDSDGAFTLEEFVGFMTPMMQGAPDSPCAFCTREEVGFLAHFVP